MDIRGLRQGPMAGSCVHVNDRFCSMKDEEFLDLLSKYHYVNVLVSVNKYGEWLE